MPGQPPPPDTPAAAVRSDGAGYLPGPKAFRSAWVTLRRQAADPLFRNGYALMANTCVTGMLGLVYWLLAARHYATQDVGRAAAAYSAMNLLSGLTALNLVGALTRFIPQSGQRTAGLVLRVYAFSSLASVLVAVPFLVASGDLGPSYAELGGVTAGLVFTACVVCWGIFTLQDGVLVGLRSAVWVPVENGTFGIVKIVLLLALAVSLPHAGIYVSWMVPVAISLPLVNALIFGRLMQPHAQLTAIRTPPSARQMGRFLAGDYTGALCVLAVTNLVPLAVAARVGPSMYAYFYMAWMVGGTMDLFAVNMATSLTVEGAFDEARLAANCRAALRRTLLILVPISAGVAVAAPVALRLYGPGYAAYGARVLQLLAVAALPMALIEMYLGALRAQSRTSAVAFIQGIRGVLILGLAFVLTGIMGMVGAGLAFLVSQVAVAAMVMPGLLSLLRRRPALAAATTASTAQPRPVTENIGTYRGDDLKLHGDSVECRRISWQEVRPMKVLIAGGAGYIGSTIASACLDAGIRPVILDSLVTGRREFAAGREFYQGDIADGPLVDRVFAEHPDIDTVIHCAALIVVPDSVSDPVGYYRANVAESLEFAAHLLRNGCRQLIFSSSAAIYHAGEDLTVDENSAIDPQSPYARTKAVCEAMLADIAAACPIRVLSLRYFNPIGADPKMRTGLQLPRPTHVLGKMVQAWEEGVPFVITGTDYPTRDGSGIRDYIHVWDLASAHVAALGKFDSLPGPTTVINLGTGRGTTVRELLDAFNRAVGGPIKAREAGRRPGDVAGAYTRIDRAQHLLNWRPRYGLAEGIRHSLEWAAIRDEVLSRDAEPGVRCPGPLLSPLRADWSVEHGQVG